MGSGARQGGAARQAARNDRGSAAAGRRRAPPPRCGGSSGGAPCGRPASLAYDMPWGTTIAPTLSPAATSLCTRPAGEGLRVGPGDSAALAEPTPWPGRHARECGRAIERASG
jgi:hypothetical protein